MTHPSSVVRTHVASDTHRFWMPLAYRVLRVVYGTNVKKNCL